MSTQVKATAGPWIVYEDTQGHLIIKSKEMNTSLASVFSTPANARLIASAPELLMACKFANEQLGFSSRKHYHEIQEDYGTAGLEVFKKFEEVIAKAEGNAE